MKDKLIAFIVLFLFICFALFIHKIKNSYKVLEIITPTKIGIDFNKDNKIDGNEIVCIQNIESFSMNNTDDFIKTYSKKYAISENEIFSLGYLAQDFAQKSLLNKNVKFKSNKKRTSECIYGNIKISSTIDYTNLLKNSGFGIVNHEISNKNRFEIQLKKAKSLNLVILNPHSYKYHKLNCEYGKAAHNKIIIPKNQLPKAAKPCKFCHQHNINHKNTEDILKLLPYTPSPKMINTQGNITLYFNDFTKHLKPDSKCATNECRAAVTLINNSKHTIDIAIYGYEDVSAITQALKNAKNRGVKIRFVYDEAFNTEKTFYKGNYIIKNIADISVSDRNSNITQSNMLMHNKFIIFDNEKVLTGSMNFSKTGLSGYDQNDLLLIKSNEIANLYTQEFEQMINGKFHNNKIINPNNNKFQLDNTQLEIYFSPKYKTSNRIIELINNAKTYIYIPTFLITHQGISNAIINAKKRGVDVKLIIDANSVNTRNTKHSQIRLAQIPVKVENYAGKLHSKTIIIDDKYIIMGSMNYSNSGENKNDENTVIIKNSELAAQYKKLFNYIWNLIPDKYLKFNPKAESWDSLGSCTDGIDNNFNGKIDVNDEFCIKK